jgi:hypothetical protein
VGVSNAVAIAGAFVQRLALARRWSETTFATATRWISAFRDRIPRTSHGGLTPPALGAERTFAGEKTICAMYERTFARAAGVSPPWRVIQWAIAKIEHCSPTRERTSKSGGRQPAVGMSNAIAIVDGFVQRPASTRRGCGNAVATVFAYRRLPGRLCATIAVLPLQARFGNHGWLTPAAPGAPTEIFADMWLRFATAFCFPRGAYAPRSWFTVYGRGANGDFCDARTHIRKSGGREPAVVR